MAEIAVVPGRHSEHPHQIGPDAPAQQLGPEGDQNGRQSRQVEDDKWNGAHAPGQTFPEVHLGLTGATAWWILVRRSPVEARHNAGVRYWWVNQNQTYRYEVRGNFLWSPKANANGARNPFYDNMRRVEPGDVVFSFCDTRIKAIAVILGRAQTGPKPDFGGAGLNWSKEGWFVPATYEELENPIRPIDHISSLRPTLPPIYSPLQSNGYGVQSVYLAEVPPMMAAVLIDCIGRQSFDEALATLTWRPTDPDGAEDPDLVALEDHPSTYREQVIRARRGQGIFRANVMLVEESCRVTGVSHRRHLRASHIKPWKDASDEERLRGTNGLLLSPHIDHLFDQGYISFSTTNTLLISSAVEADLLDRWGISRSTKVGSFSREQQAFLDYHRAEIFLTDA